MDPVRIRYMKEWIAQLPKGNITYKSIRGKKYAYLQWTENGKQRSRRVKDAEFCFGPITKRCVIYRGDDVVLKNGIVYKNIENYLKSL